MLNFFQKMIILTLFTIVSFIASKLIAMTINGWGDAGIIEAAVS
jgi:hypothetical protein